MTKPLLASLLWLAGASAALAAPLATDSRITAVTVYLDRAVVTRTATVHVEPGASVEVAFDRLPASLLDESLQVSGQGSAQSTLVDVVAQPVFVDFAANDQAKALEDELRELVRQEATLADRLTVIDQQRDYILKIQTATATPSKDAPTTAPETWLTFLKFSEEQLTKFAAERQAATTQREALAAKRAALEQQLDSLRSDGSRSYKRVVIRFDVATAGDLNLTLRYAVLGASWTPGYDVRADSAQAAVRLGYFGTVRQNTGEAWTGVDLTLSTARPSLGGGAPELGPWVVQQREIQPPLLEEPAATVLGAGPAAPMEKRKIRVVTSQALMMRDVSAASATIDTQTTSATFHIESPTDVASDHTPRKVPIGTLALKAELGYQATPKLVPAAFLTAHVVNTSDYPLLAGSANVFLDDTFVANTELRAVLPGEKFDLALGADDGVTVKRKLVNRLTEDTGLVTKGRRLSYDILLTIQNHKKTAVALALTDQVPVSRHEKIVVKITAPDAKELKPDADGTLKWNLKLAPGEQRELPLKFTIEHPADLPVTGIE